MGGGKSTRESWLRKIKYDKTIHSIMIFFYFWEPSCWFWFPLWLCTQRSLQAIIVLPSRKARLLSVFLLPCLFPYRVLIFFALGCTIQSKCINLWKPKNLKSPKSWRALLAWALGLNYKHLSRLQLASTIHVLVGLSVCTNQGGSGGLLVPGIWGRDSPRSKGIVWIM